MGAIFNNAKIKAMQTVTFGESFNYHINLPLSFFEKVQVALRKLNFQEHSVSDQPNNRVSFMITVADVEEAAFVKQVISKMVMTSVESEKVVAVYGKGGVNFQK